MRFHKRSLQMIKHKLDAFYDGVCDVFQYETLPGTIQQVREVVGEENIPCHLNYAGMSAARAGEPGAEIGQSITLFLAPEVVILPGSKIRITQNQVEGLFECSGPPAIYPTHQEVPLSLTQKWA